MSSYSVTNEMTKEKMINYSEQYYTAESKTKNRGRIARVMMSIVRFRTKKKKNKSKNKAKMLRYEREKKKKATTIVREE